MALYSGSGFDYTNAGRVSNSDRRAWRALTGPAVGITQGVVKAGLGAINFFSGGGYGGGAAASGAMKAAGGIAGGFAPEITSMFEKSANRRFGFNRNTKQRTSQAAAVGVTSAGIGNTIASAVLGNYGAAVTEAGQLGMGLAAGLQAQNNGGNFEDAYVRGAYSPIKAGEMLSGSTKIRKGSPADTLSGSTAITPTETPSDTGIGTTGRGMGIFAGASNEDPLIQSSNDGFWQTANKSPNISSGGFGYKNGGLYKRSYGDGGSVKYPLIKEGGYDIKRALELGYEPDEDGHLPSRDYETGQYLKAKNYYTTPMSIINDELLGYKVRQDLNGNLYSIPRDQQYPDFDLNNPPVRTYSNGGQVPEIGSSTSDSIVTDKVEEESVIIPAYMREAFLSKYGKHFPELMQSMNV